MCKAVYGNFRDRILHWPKGESGVTLGAGYDVKLRSKEEVLQDLMAIGLSPEVAEVVSKAAMQRLNEPGMTGLDAKKFVQDYQNLIALNKEQIMGLLRRTAPHYEWYVVNYVRIPLKQYQFDALVSFVYNPGGSFLTVAREINTGHLNHAADLIRRRVPHSNSPVYKGLVARRDREVNLLLKGQYT